MLSGVYQESLSVQLQDLPFQGEVEERKGDPFHFKEAVTLQREL